MFEPLRENLLVLFKEDGWIEVKTTGPVPKNCYAKIRPFLQQHFQYNHEERCYEVYTENPRFIKLLFDELQKAGFLAHQVGHFKFYA